MTKKNRRGLSYVENSNRRRARCRQSGTCMHCSKKAIPGKTCCKYHLKRASLNARKAYSQEIKLAKIRCPECGNPINWVEPVGRYNFDGRIYLLAECWSGSIEKEKPRHTFLIELKGFKIVKWKK